MEDLTGKQLGPYQVVAPLGEGGMAAVYKAYQPGMDRYVALKILPRKLAEDPQFVGRFNQEAKVLAKLQHPHILPVFDFGEADGYTYIVMPFVESGTLADLLRGQPLPLKQIRSIISQIGGALHYAHTHGLVHRDVKPSNVLVDESGNCLLTDFGIAKMVEGTAKFTSTGGVIGTPAYMSPEQGRGEKLDGRSDIYSLGIMLFEMATGRVPFNAETPLAIIFKHISDPLPMPRTINPALPESVERVILKALAKNPEERFQKAEEMVEALTVESRVPGQYSGTSKTLIETMPSGEAAKKPRRAFPVWAWLTAVMGVVVVVGMVVIGGGMSIIPLIAARATEVDSNSQIVSTSATAEIGGSTGTPAQSHSATKTPTAQPPPSSTPRSISTLVASTDDAVMVFVPAGEFAMGSDTADTNAQPVHTVTLDAFWIDRTEVTNAKYALCVAAGVCSPPISGDFSTYDSRAYPTGSFPYYQTARYNDYPVVNVDWDQAKAYCDWADRRLPTEAEWEKAARGTDGRVYPWGNQMSNSFVVNLCDATNCPLDWRIKGINDGYAYTAPVGSYPRGASPYGALDMAGNVSEWVNDLYDKTYYARSPADNPPGPASGGTHVLRGGSWGLYGGDVRAAKRGSYMTTVSNVSIGFRCALSP